MDRSKSNQMSVSALREAIGRAVPQRRCGGLETPVGALRLGAVHEWFTQDTGPPAAWSGAEEPAPPLCLMVDLACRALSASAVSAVAWVGRWCWPCPLVLDRHPALAEASVFIDPPDGAARVWCVDLACRCPHPTAVIADGRGLAPAQTRRLQLSAGAGAGLCLLARHARELGVLSASSTRRLVSRSPGPSQRPRWIVTLLRNKDSPALTEERPSVVVEWDHAEGGLRVACDVGDRAASPRRPRVARAS